VAGPAAARRQRAKKGDAVIEHGAVIGRGIVAPVLVLVLAALGACSDDPVTEVVEGEIHRAHWQSMGITSYRFEFHQGCFCDPVTNTRVFITVEDRVIQAIVDATSGEPIGGEYWDRFKTIDQLYDVIIQAQMGGADRIVVEYDERYDYPSSIEMDHSFGATDDEWSVLASGLEVGP
jgi:hypothetical protein